MKKYRVLVADDELSILKYVSARLQREGFEVTTASNGKEAIVKAEQENPDLIILDIMMPEMSGFDVCSRLREWTEAPIIMLSAKAAENDKVKCLDLGADDYITKPFGTQELLARVNAVLRRAEISGTPPAHPTFQSGDLTINFAERKVTVAEREIKLTPTEYKLLQELTLNAGKVLSHTYLLQKIWGPEYQSEKEYLHEFTRRLRNKLERGASQSNYIVSVAGIGYQFKTEESTD